MTNEMVQRVAMAICEVSSGNPGNTHEWRSFEKQARAAIEAMRHPTDEMVFRASLVRDAPLDGRKPARILSAMVDAALQDSASQRQGAH